jgi:Ca-activated chloride channel family protein
MMDALAAFHFERPIWLLASLPAAVLWFLVRRSSGSAQRWRRVIDPVLLPHLLTGDDRRARIVPADWLFAGSIVAAIAIAGPAWQREPSPFADAKPPVAVVLKVTLSMLSEDLAPTRLDRARQKLADALAAREGASTALIAYAGSAHLVLPPTPDSAVVIDLAKALAPEIMPKTGDDLAGALALARRALAGTGQGGSVLLLADAAQLDMAAQPPGAPALTILALHGPDAAATGLTEAAKTLGGTVVATTPDQSDVAVVVRRLDGGDNAPGVAGEGEHWREAGYWLVPALALLVLLWFRRGWVLA